MYVHTVEVYINGDKEMLYDITYIPTKHCSNILVLGYFYMIVLRQFFTICYNMLLQHCYTMLQYGLKNFPFV